MPDDDSLPTNLYEMLGTVLPEERAAQRALEYADVVSHALLGNRLRGKTVADLGAGDEPDLGRWIVARGGDYVALDVRDDAVNAQRAAGFRAVRGSVEAIPSGLGAFDIAHARFVLMHLKPLARVRAIRDILRLAGERAIFIEFDWTPFEGAPGGAVNRIRDFSRRVFNGHVHFEFGRHLPEVVARAPHAIMVRFRVRSRTYGRPAGDYYRELLPRVSSMGRPIAMLVEHGLLGKSALLEHTALLRELEEEAARSNPAPFRPPDIVAVKATRR